MGRKRTRKGPEGGRRLCWTVSGLADQPVDTGVGVGAEGFGLNSMEERCNGGALRPMVVPRKCTGVSGGNA